MVRRRRIPLALLALLVALAAPLAAVTAARADTVPFALLVVDGFKFQPSLVPGEPFTFVSPNRAIHFIVNNAKDPTVLGRATIALWTQTVPPNPDPFFGPIRPLGALGVFEFDPPLNLVAHLGFIDTPAGARTTIGLYQPATVARAPNDAFLTYARGTWVAGPAQGIAGADADDMVVAGLLVLGTATDLPDQSRQIIPYFPHFPFTPPSSSVGTPTGLECLLGDCTGSFHGQADSKPYRGYTVNTPLGNPARLLHLGVIHAGGDEYMVVACGLDTAPPSNSTVGSCTLSGAGAIDQALAGWATYTPPGPLELYTTLHLSPFLVLP